LVGIARALASNAAIRQSENFSMTEFPPRRRPVYQYQRATAANPAAGSRFRERD
jgi:hypothetical protein